VGNYGSDYKAVVEQLINGYLLLRCEKNGTAELFVKLERKPFVDKWTVLPATLIRPTHSRRAVPYTTI
jgi:hypothetical protein